MKSVQILTAIALAIVFFLFFRFLIKRIWLFALLRRFVKKHSYTCKIPLSCLLPTNRSNRLVLMETDTTVYAIKLFGLLRKHCEIHFWNADTYSVEWYVTRYELIGKPPIGHTDARRRGLGNTDWNIRTEKEIIPVLLISPAHAPVRLTQTQVTHLVDLRAGDKIGDMLFADLDFLFRFIVNREK